MAPFLFYSGYGVSEQIKKRGTAYVNHMPKSRILKTWIHFAIAVLIYLFLSFILKSKYAPATILLSFIGWESIGNSSWYIFAILFLYAAAYFSFKNLSGVRAPISCVISSLLYIVVMYFAKDGSWWYDTILCYFVGILFSCYKEEINRFLNNKYLTSCLICLALTVAFFLLRSHLIAYELLSIIFCIDILLFCACVKIENKVLFFLGKHAFEIYILQRIPMIVLSRYISGYSFIVACFAASIILAVAFKKIEGKVDILLKI